MTGRREFIRKSLLGSAGITIAGLSIGNPDNIMDAGTAARRKGKAGTGPEVEVEAEEEVYQYMPAENGAGPMWCSGSTCIVRTGREVYASGIETIPGAKPLNNCRWMLFERTGKGWVLKLADKDGRTREPAPMTTFHDGRIFLSVNPTLTAHDTYDGPARPEILQFMAGKELEPVKLLPGWRGTPPFTEHSYRSFAADGRSGELILFQNIGYTHAEWAFLSSDGKWSANGKLEWPFGSEYEEPEPIRVCYPNVALRDRAIYFCGVSDIIEPKKEWRRYKKELTGKEWDYDFRRLFFTWSDDITTGKFHDWIEIAGREATCGWIFPCDLWVAPDKAIHMLWTERAIDERLREKFFPGEKQSNALNYAIVRNGMVELRKTLALAEEGGSQVIPGPARFHITPDNRLFVIYFMKGKDQTGNEVAENRLVELKGGGASGTSAAIPLKKPFSSFFTATVRAGSKPSWFIDLLGIQDGVRNTISYARIKIN